MLSYTYTVLTRLRDARWLRIAGNVVLAILVVGNFTGFLRDHRPMELFWALGFTVVMARNVAWLVHSWNGYVIVAEEPAGPR